MTGKGQRCGVAEEGIKRKREAKKNREAGSGSDLIKVVEFFFFFFFRLRK